MNTWKDYLRTTLYLHHRLLTSGIFMIGGLIALSVVYVFLFTSAPVEPTQDQGAEIVISKGGLERITNWSAAKQRDASANVVISNTAFAIPSVAP